jgi:hypothetical protein
MSPIQLLKSSLLPNGQFVTTARLPEGARGTWTGSEKGMVRITGHQSQPWWGRVSGH